MGKPLTSQKRGKGSPAYTAPSHRFKAEVRYRNVKEPVVRGEIIEFVDDPARTAILMKIVYSDGLELMLPAFESAKIGDIIGQGDKAALSLGSVMKLKYIPEGYPVFNIETKPGRGGNIARSSGASCFIISKDKGLVFIRLPSKQNKYFSEECRATIGNAAGGGRTAKPMLKAGVGDYKRAARKKYRKVRGVKMCAVDHPYGGKEHHGSVSIKGDGGCPGQHVGSFGSSRTGRRKR
ncbi:MAG: 50S ribosomal protein L2 [Candidatus Micrarchaeota archaeon]